MKRVLVLLTAASLVVAVLAAPVSADPPSPITGNWLGKDFGSSDTSNVVVKIKASGRYRITDDAGSICLNRVGEFVAVSVSGMGVFSPDGMTFTTDASDHVFCHTGTGRVDTGPLGGSVVFVYDVATDRLEDHLTVPTGTCYWRKGTPQPANCPPGP